MANALNPLIQFAIYACNYPIYHVHYGISSCNRSKLISSYCTVLEVISPDFSLELTGFFQGKHFIHFLVLKNFVLDKCILDLVAEQVYSKLQVINLKKGSYSKP